MVENNIIELHKQRFKGLIYLLKLRKSKYKSAFNIAFIISIVQFVFLIFHRNIYTYEFLKKSVELNLSYAPNMLGFLLSGFAIVVGFSNISLLKTSVHYDKPSIYQILSSNFSFQILILLLIASISFSIKWFMGFEIVVPLECDLLFRIFNSLICSFLLFLFVFASYLTFFVILNLFTLSQLNSLQITLEEFKKDPSTKNRDN